MKKALCRQNAGLALALTVALVAPIQSAQAGTLFPLKLKCPVGEKEFVANVRVAWTDYGTRPDGKAYNNYMSPQPINECPDNKLLIYRKFNDEEVKLLTALIASDSYRAIRKSETSYYAAGWLERQIAPAPLTDFAFLQKAKWQAESDEQRIRYTQEMLAAANPAIAVQQANSSLWWQLNWQAVNARRELGDFAGAKVALDALPLEQLNVAVPAKQIGEPAVIEEKVRPFPGAPEMARKRANVLNTKEIQEALRKARLYESFQSMELLIAEGNNNAEPVSLIPDRERLRRCKWFADALTLSETAICNSPAIKPQVEAYRGPKESNYD